MDINSDEGIHFPAMKFRNGSIRMTHSGIFPPHNSIAAGAVNQMCSTLRQETLSLSSGHIPEAVVPVLTPSNSEATSQCHRVH